MCLKNTPLVELLNSTIILILDGDGNHGDNYG